MSGMLRIIELNAVWEDNLNSIWYIFCGLGHVIPKNDSSAQEEKWDFSNGSISV